MGLPFWQRSVLLTLACNAWAPGSAAPPPSNEDLRHVRNLADPHISPDGARVIVTIADTAAEGGRTHLRLVDVVKNTSRQLTR